MSFVRRAATAGSGLVHAWVAALLDLVFARQCAGCGAAGAGLCRACGDALREAPARLHRPQPCPAGLPPLAAAADYAGPVRMLLLAHKEHGRLELAAPLGEALGRALRLLGEPGRPRPEGRTRRPGPEGRTRGPGPEGRTRRPGPEGSARARPLVLVPVPSSAAAVRARGQDHALRLARATARSLRRGGVSARAAPLLRPARALADQSGLSTSARSANLDHALACRRACPGVAVVLVDDVVTTGATLTEAARALRAAGANVRGAVVVGATQRRRPVEGDAALSRSRRQV